jgi:hypothetical protein
MASCNLVGHRFCASAPSVGGGELLGRVEENASLYPDRKELFSCLLVAVAAPLSVVHENADVVRSWQPEVAIPHGQKLVREIAVVLDLARRQFVHALVQATANHKQVSMLAMLPHRPSMLSMVQVEGKPDVPFEIAGLVQQRPVCFQKQFVVGR